MAINVYAVFNGLAANADQIETGWALASIRSTVSGLALNSENPISVVSQLRPLPMTAFLRAELGLWLGYVAIVHRRQKAENCHPDHLMTRIGCQS